MDDVIAWLLAGDATIQYMTHRFLLRSDANVLQQLQQKTVTQGYGARLLACRTQSGHWGLYYYQPKWTCTHYTLLDLKNLCVPDTLAPCREEIARMFDDCMNADGGLNLSKHEHPSDICVDGMALQYAAYFCKDEPRLAMLAGHLLAAQKADGGFTWDALSAQGDPHTTLCVLEGLGQYGPCAARGQAAALEAAKRCAVAYLLSQGLFMDHADKRFGKLSHPYRYRYDLLRALECFATQRVPYDIRMQPALDWLLRKRQPDGRWYLENQHRGNVHFVMEAVGEPSRFITLKALCILAAFRPRQQP
jgi:hypothetical protein